MVIAFVLLIGVVIYAINPKYVIIYWMLWRPFAFPIICILLNINDPNIGLEVNNDLKKCSIYLFLFLTLVEFFYSKNKKIDYQLLVCLGLLFIYQIIGYNYNLNILKSFIFDIASLILPFVYFIICRNNCVPSLKDMINISLFIVLVEFFACIANLFGYGKIIDDEELVSGTFRRFNDLGNYLSTLLLLNSIGYFVYNGCSKKTFIFLVILVGLMIAMSGAKMSFALYLFIIITCVFFYSTIKRKVYFLLASCVLYELFFNLLTQIEGFDRILSIGKNVSDGSFITTHLSIYLITYYFPESPIFGSFRMNLGASAYNYSDYYITYSSDIFYADAKLASVLVENGIVGLLLHLYVFFFLLFKCKKRNYIMDNKIIVILFSYYLILTITESGFFDEILFPMSLLFLVVNKKTALQKFK